MSTNESAAGGTTTAAATTAAAAAGAEQLGRAPKPFDRGQTVCNEKNEKGKLCNGHLKQVSPINEDALKHLRGEDLLYKCQSCGTLYMGPPLGHVRDPRTQSRFVERELVEILNAAGGTLPAFRLNERGAYVPVAEAAHGGPAPAAKAPAPAAAKGATPAAPAATPAPPPAVEETPEQKRARKKAEAEARKASAVPIPGASGPPPEGETPEQKIARLKAVVEEAKRRKEAAGAGGAETAAPPVVPADIPPSAPPAPSPTSGTDSSPSADAHRPAAEAQAATGMASAAPLSPAAATASPAAAEQAAKAKPAAGSHSGFKVPPELQPKPGETREEKLARLRATVEAAKRAAGKL
jgi:hypothetical protein